MSGTVPLEEMSEERAKLLTSVAHLDPRASKSQLLATIDRLADAASTCPRTKCATCSFMAKHEAAALPKETST
jgi:hypothetical protein